MKKVIAVDFDGTLCEDKYPEIGEKKKIILEALKKRKQEGYAIILWTCREGQLLQNAIDWCKANGIEFDAVNESIPEWKEFFGNDTRKVGATEYWDDKSINTALLEALHKVMLVENRDEEKFLHMYVIYREWFENYKPVRYYYASSDSKSRIEKIVEALNRNKQDDSEYHVCRYEDAEKLGIKDII